MQSLSLRLSSIAALALLVCGASAQAESPLQMAASSAAGTVRPSDVQAANKALAEAVRCTTRTEATPFPGCGPLEQASAERVRFPELKDSGRPGEWTQTVELRLNDGSWKHYEEMHRSFHGMLWVPEVGLYVGYAAWYGEQGGVVMVHPESGALEVAAGIPQLTPDGALMVVAHTGVFDDGHLRVQVFAMESKGPRKLSERSIVVRADTVERVVLVQEHSAAVVYLLDWDGKRAALSVDLSEHWPAKAADLLSVEACEKSENARYVTGDQVFLRAGPSKQAEVVAALPWGSCVQLQETPGDWELVRMADQRGFVSSKLVAEAAPARLASSKDFVQTFCQAGPPGPEGYGGPEMKRALQANERAGVPSYYARPFWDDYCVSLRPTETQVSLGGFERTDSENINVRFATWTLALAPESAYRSHSSAAVLNASPLFRPTVEAHSPNTQRQLPSSEGYQALGQVFGSKELRAASVPPADVHLLQVLVQEEGLLVSSYELHQSLGVSQGGFPGGQFQLSEDLSQARFDRDLPGAVLDPCTGEFLPTSVSQIAYMPGSGQLHAKVTPKVQERLKQCVASQSPESLPQLRFVLLVDESHGGKALAAVAGKAERKLLYSSDEMPSNVVSLRWSADGVDRAFLRAALVADCGFNSFHIFQFYDGSAWQRVQVEAWDSNDCGA